MRRISEAENAFDTLSCGWRDVGRLWRETATTTISCSCSRTGHDSCSNVHDVPKQHVVNYQKNTTCQRVRQMRWQGPWSKLVSSLGLQVPILVHIGLGCTPSHESSTESMSLCLHIYMYVSGLSGSVGNDGPVNCDLCVRQPDTITKDCYDSLTVAS